MWLVQPVGEMWRRSWYGRHVDVAATGPIQASLGRGETKQWGKLLNIEASVVTDINILLRSV